MAQVNDVNAEETKEHHRLTPLSGVAPERAGVFEKHRADVWLDEADPTENAFGCANAAGVTFLRAGSTLIRAGSTPMPAGPDAGAALDGGDAFEERSAEPRESQETEKADMTHQNQEEEARQGHNAFTPLNDAGGEPIAGQKRKLREARFDEQLVEHFQDASLQKVVGRGLRLPPGTGQDRQQPQADEGSDLKTAPVQIAGELNREPGTGDSRQGDEKRDQDQGDDVEMPRDTARQPKRSQQRSDQEQKRPRGKQRRFDEFPAKNGLRRNRHRQQKVGFTIAEKVCVTDNQVTQEEQCKQKCEEDVEQSLSQHSSQAGKRRDELEALEKQAERQNEVTGEKKQNDRGEQARLVADGFKPPPMLQPVDLQQQEQWESGET